METKTEDTSLTDATLSLGSSRPTRTPWPSGTYTWKEFKSLAYWNKLKLLLWYSPWGLFTHWKLQLSPIPHMQKCACEWTSVSCALVQTISKYFIETALLPLSLICIEGLQEKEDFKRTWLNIFAIVTAHLSGWCPFFALICRDRQEFQPHL